MQSPFVVHSCNQLSFEHRSTWKIPKKFLDVHISLLYLCVNFKFKFILYVKSKKHEKKNQKDEEKERVKFAKPQKFTKP